MPPVEMLEEYDIGSKDLADSRCAYVAGER
jgi:hypothetical protein